ncbi:MAG TPA: alginate lyase family protein [Vicinamibacterales bacterium]
MRITRLAHMDSRELSWRATAAVRTALDYAAFSIRPPRWDRRTLVKVLAAHPELEPAQRAARAEDWSGAQRSLACHFAGRPPRFLIAPPLRPALVAAIKRAFPGGERAAAARADRIVRGEYDLLGYRALRFDGWQHDPVHHAEAPSAFWASVEFLDPRHGDHKIIWELNRHQQFLALGQAFWLTGDSTYRNRFIEELTSWLGANPPLMGINWASMLELAFRSLSWLWGLEFFASEDTNEREPWIVDLLVGIDRQLSHVERNLSYYFSPNTHLLGEALALYVCGRALPELRASRRWEATGRRILVDEMSRQIGADGVHRERSTHYHRYTLDFYLLALAVARITGDEAAADFERAAARLALAARRLADDRGRLPHFGDDDGGRLAPLGDRAADDLRDTLAVASVLVNREDLATGALPEEALWWLAHPALRQDDRLAPSRPLRPSWSISAALPDCGYYVSRSARGDHLVIDGGQHGFKNGGHAHADALSLTLTLAGTPLLIDCGTACYTTNPEVRDRMRSSALHNTVVVDDRSQSIPSGPFHWSHVANGVVRRWRANDGFDYFDGAHDGYRPLVHRRHVLAMHGDLLVVADLIDGAGHHSAAVHWHIDPRWNVTVDGSRAVLTQNGERVEIVVPGGMLERFEGDAATGLGWHAPVYGRVEPTTTLRATQVGATPFWMISVFSLDVTNAVRSAEIVPVWAEAGTLRESLGLRIERQSSTDWLVIAEPIDAAIAPTWRIAELETDARMLFCRVAEPRRVTRLALVDGSLVRTSGRRAFQLALPRVVPDLHLDLRAEPRIAGPLFGARLVVGGEERPVAMERRATARAQDQEA